MKSKNGLPWRIKLLASAALCIGLITNAQPTITTFSPLSGPVGTIVTISGTNFNATPANNIVYMGATRATVSAASTTSLTITVPTGATYENISVTEVTSHLTGYSSKPFMLTFSCSGPTDSASFSSATSFPTGFWPHDAVICDFDGDNKADMVSVNNDANTLGILRNTGALGTISFASPSYITGSPGGYYIDKQDIDGDGKIDLIAAYSGMDFQIYRNTSVPGNITFAAPVTVNASSQIRGISSGDIDKDGKPDIAVTGCYPHGVDVFRNTSTVGSISFASEQIFTAGFFPIGVSLTDLDGDLLLDLEVINNDSTISLLRNISSTGIIAFAPATTLTSNNFAQAFTFGDIDGDGKKDMITTSNYSNTISSWLNISTPGAISFGTENANPATDPRNSKIADLNGDGKPELVVADEYVTVFDNTSTPGVVSFSPGVSFFKSLPVPYNVQIADLDEDGKPEIVQANTDDFTLGGQTITVLKNDECLTTGILGQKKTDQPIVVYPNPFSDNAFINFEPAVENATVRILNSLGQEVRTTIFSGAQLEIERAELHSGIYLLQIHFETSKVISEKIIIR